MIELYLIRHAECEVNLHPERIGGDLITPL